MDQGQRHREAAQDAGVSSCHASCSLGRQSLGNRNSLTRIGTKADCQLSSAARWSTVESKVSFYDLCAIA
jgi:hypothetical protein